MSHWALGTFDAYFSEFSDFLSIERQRVIEEVHAQFHTKAA